jgi:hypothetical protein
MANMTPIGPGTRISMALKRFGIKPTKGCRCYELAREMNRVGSEGVLAELDKYTNNMYDSIKEWRKSQEGFTIIVAQPPKVVIREFITWACSA